MDDDTRVCVIVYTNQRNSVNAKTTHSRRACRFSMVWGLERNGQFTVGMYTSLSKDGSGFSSVDWIELMMNE